MAKKASDNQLADLEASLGGRKGKRKKKSNTVNVFLILFMLMGAVFLPTAFLLFVGLLPMIVAFFVDPNPSKIKAVTVGAMNIAGCVPFLFELWLSEHTLEQAVSIISDPFAIIVMYSAAAIGYLIDWIMTIAVANVLYQRGLARKKLIEETQAELIKRWGMEVSGTIPLDHQGFPLEDPATKE